MSQTYSDNALLIHPKPEFEHYRKNTAGVYTDWTSEAEVIATIAAGRRAQKTFRISGSDYLCESDGLTFSNKTRANLPISLTISVDTGVLITAGLLITGMLINPATDLTSFKVGTIPGGSDLILEQDITAIGNWISFYLLFKSISNTTFYISGITGTVNIEFINQ